MKILITGANGMLGHDLCLHFKNSNHEIIKSTRKEMDITNLNSCYDFISKNTPEIIIHCAAYTNVEQAEIEKEKANLVNFQGTKNLVEICNKLNCKLIFISTDYVFDGEKNSPYLPNDKTNPINEYGKSKDLAEKEIINNCKKYQIIRTSWLYGKNGKNFVQTMLNLKDKKEIKVIENQIGCPTWTVELSRGIEKLLSRENGIYQIVSNGQTSWFEFAKKIFEIAEINANISPCTSNEYKTLAKRPNYSVLKSDIILKDWDIALEEYLKTFLF